MKKEKSKSEGKKAKKELEDKLINAFTAVVAEYGKAKKTKAIIEKFTKLLSKKVELKNKVVIEKVEETVEKPSVEQAEIVAKPKVVKKAAVTKK
ncbi:MAG: hypothetical protein V4546_16265 [Bacteroidota bacterium]|uniref:Uncharacterized protein n=1 Tax=Pedobacter cryotolerans TaxID=2571270 RepID=A0A4U1C4W2_9SPHI|nr:hypothetical protein [Pedobacter cryotolerans]TKB99447.1 hypothetical protein FA045_13280 [Pedobacter cryotolerans]